MLFERTQEKSAWEPAKPPQVLGELLDSRYMLPLLFPSDPRMLSALPGKTTAMEEAQRERRGSVQLNVETRSVSRASFGSRGAMAWRSRNRRLREVNIGTLQWVDGVRSAARWGRPVEPDEDDKYERKPSPYSSDDPQSYDDELRIDIASRVAPLTRKPSGKSKGRASLGGETTPV